MDVLGKHMHDCVLSKLEKAYDSMVRQAASSEENDMSILFEQSLCPFIYIVMCTPFLPQTVSITSFKASLPISMHLAHWFFDLNIGIFLEARRPGSCVP